MNNSPISVVMSLKDYETWTHDHNSFMRVFIFDDSMVTYSMTDYDNLWNECLYCLKDEEKRELDQLEDVEYHIRKNELFSDFIMRTDAYSYNDYINSDSFIPSIWLNQLGFQYFYVINFGYYRDDKESYEAINSQRGIRN